jgi:uroporphyrinogen decarboxylase
MNLTTKVKQAGKRLVMPLMGYPGIQLTRTSIKQNEFNWGVHFWTLSTLEKVFRPDGLFFFMDLAVEANALGLPVKYPLYDSPTVEDHLVKKLDDLNQFLACDPLKDGRLIAFVETVKLMKQGLPAHTVKGAYITGPFTLAGLMVGANDIAMLTIMDQSLVMGVLETATSTIIRYARALEQAGADVIAVLEPTAVMLSPESFRKFSAQFVSRISGSLEVPSVLHICGDSTHLIPDMCGTGVQGLSLDSAVDPVEALELMSDDVVFIGNVDPVSVMRAGTPSEVRRNVHDLLEKVKDYPNFLLSTGCDLPADTPLKNIHAFMDAAREWNHQNYEHPEYAVMK